LNILSGPSSGKSTSAAGLYYKMKMAHIKCELVTEFAKDLVYSDRIQMLTDNQEMIFAEQNYRLHILKDKVDWAITDTSLLLGLVYPPDWYPQSFKPFVLDIYNTYNNVNVYIKRPDSFQQYGRAHDHEQSKQLDDLVINMLQEYDIPYTVFEANDDTADDLFEFIQKH